MPRSATAAAPKRLTVGLAKDLGVVADPCNGRLARHAKTA